MKCLINIQSVIYSTERAFVAGIDIISFDYDHNCPFLPCLLYCLIGFAQDILFYWLTNLLMVHLEIVSVVCLEVIKSTIIWNIFEHENFWNWGGCHEHGNEIYCWTWCVSFCSKKKCCNVFTGFFGTAIQVKCTYTISPEGYWYH